MSGASKWAFNLIPAAVAMVVLVVFLTPTARHSGLNLYPETLFPKMVQGTAHKPFVSRALLPGTVRVLTAMTPATWRDRLDEITENSSFLSAVFDRFIWEKKGSVRYYWAALLMWLSYWGFAHFTVALTCRELGWRAGPAWRAVLGAAGLLGLPALFKYSSFPYDPTQAFLFTLALYLLSADRMRALLVLFPLCCLSKETAVLLIPILVFHRRGRVPGPVVLREAGTLIVIYGVIRGGLAWLFRDNPGTMLEFHLLDHNLAWIRGGWSVAELLAILVLGALVLFDWRQKPRFLKVALLATLPVLLGMALFFGFIDEWRMYYEAYAVVFALAVATVARPLRGKPGF